MTNIKGRDDLIIMLEEHGIEYESIIHPPVATVADVQLYAAQIAGAHCKNLFVKGPKKDFYLLVIPDDKKINLKQIANLIGCKRLSFASVDELQHYLGISPGSVSPFAIINDSACLVRVIIDNALLTVDKISFHPLINTETLVVNLAEFMRFMAICQHPVHDLVIE